MPLILDLVSNICKIVILNPLYNVNILLSIFTSELWQRLKRVYKFKPCLNFLQQWICSMLLRELLVQSLLFFVKFIKGLLLLHQIQEVKMIIMLRPRDQTCNCALPFLFDSFWSRKLKLSHNIPLIGFHF